METQDSENAGKLYIQSYCRLILTSYASLTTFLVSCIHASCDLHFSSTVPTSSSAEEDRDFATLTEEERCASPARSSWHSSSSETHDSPEPCQTSSHLPHQYLPPQRPQQAEAGDEQTCLGLPAPLPGLPHWVKTTDFSPCISPAFSRLKQAEQPTILSRLL